ncbi:sigma-70 family RNA polymerase sigma factor [Modestobacter sp. VKM Ac-2983]|uniref:RNA polymerase sigma factor n=1 Tax=Modestobacter sp. VKM Ac-2983 TaxID=3004137 RepID=UPI0022AB78FD|nr:sigma-70 family RNA polymerase sigma factor [Modestobacter sp. VKM Ac-2983]MCZ2806870.1 sigma-70 family RNA polymerase sigma factor [Modestobacter sp. VKM Ac-2983]
MQGQPPPAPDDPPAAVEVRFEDAYRSSGTAVLGYALRRSESREDAFDVVAETFATAWRRRADMPADLLEVRPWLFGIARNCLANASRSNARAGRLGDRLAAAFTDAAIPDPATLHEHRVGSREVHEALGRLSAEDRELVTLIAWEGLTPAQAADALGVAPGTARVRLHRARARLRADLSGADDPALPDPAHPQEADRAR